MLLSMPTLGERLKAVRKAARPTLTQAKLGRGIGVTQSAVAKWERDETLPDALQLIALARLLTLPIEHLVVGVDLTYDRWRRDLSDHGLLVQPAPTLRGGADETVAARLKAEQQARRDLIKKIHDATSEMVRIATQLEREGKAADVDRSGRRHGDRKAG